MPARLSPESAKPEFRSTQPEVEGRQLCFFGKIPPLLEENPDLFVFSQSPGEHVTARTGFGDPDNHYLLCLFIKRRIKDSEIWLNYSLFLGNDSEGYRLDIDTVVTPVLERDWLSSTFVSDPEDFIRLISRLTDSVGRGSLVDMTDNFTETTMTAKKANELFEQFILELD